MEKYVPGGAGAKMDQIDKITGSRKQEFVNLVELSFKNYNLFADLFTIYKIYKQHKNAQAEAMMMMMMMMMIMMQMMMMSLMRVMMMMMIVKMT